MHRSPVHVRLAPGLAPPVAAVLALAPALAAAPMGEEEEAPGVRFSEVAAASGIDFVHFTGRTNDFFFPEITAAGVALLDYDADGDLDVYLLQGGVLHPEKGIEDALVPPVGPLPPVNRLYRNELISDSDAAGRLVFTDVTEGSGAGDAGYAQGVATGDFDNDGDVDLYVTNMGPDVLLANQGDGTFADVTAAAGLGDPRWTTSAAFLDYDRDGWLDLFVLAYAEYSLAVDKACYGAKGVRDYCGPGAYPPAPARLYRNDGRGRFVDVSSRTGIDRAYGHGLGVCAADVDGNGWTDVYVANDGDANQLWMNDEGRFENAGLLSGAAVNGAGQPEAGMGLVVEDVDDDGDVDMYLTHLDGETNTLYENLGGGMFRDATARAGLGAVSRPVTGFGVAWVDLDNDGDLDLYVANGAARAIDGGGAGDFPYEQRNHVMVRLRDGSYVDRSAAAGAALELAEVSRGVAAGDLDNDGDVDLVVSNNNAPARLLRNDLDTPGSWFSLRVIDGALGRDAYGAEVRLELDDGRALLRRVHTDGSYLSAGDPRVHFAWRGATAPVRARVTLPGGRGVVLEDVRPGTFATVRVAAEESAASGERALEDDDDGRD